MFEIKVLRRISTSWRWSALPKPAPHLRWSKCTADASSVIDLFGGAIRAYSLKNLMFAQYSRGISLFPFSTGP
jgi:hypothetical protein